MKPWDKEVDVLVIGAGAGGMTAAITAHFEGCTVLLAEKTDRIGGSTAISGGAVWAPLNTQSAKVGHPDSFEKAWTYMRNTVGDAAPPSMQRTFLESSAAAVDFLERNTEVQLAARSYSPDYYPDREGAAMGGRSLDPRMFDGRLLGTHFRELRDPLPEFMVLGGMMITMTDANHLLAVTRSFASWKEGMKLVLRYVGDRLRGYHRGTRLVLGNALAARLFKTVLDRRIEYWLGAPLQQLLVEAGRRFVNEATSYHEFVLGMYRSHQQVPTLPAFLVCDSNFMERWGLGLALPGGRPREHLVRAGYLYRAGTLDELAAQLGIDAAGLKASAQRFNHYAETGEDPEFGKGSTAYNLYLGDAAHRPNACLGPLRQGPFYAVKVYAGDIGTACGIRCNENAQALDADDRPIAGLYAAGNDMQSVMGGQYPAPGITLGPALTFGWIAGRHAAAQHAQQPSQVAMEIA